MAVLEYLNENNEWKRVNAYGVSSVNGQQGDVRITPESIGAPTKDRVEKLDRELQERLKKVEWKDITEDFNNSEFPDEAFIFCLSLQKEGKYYILEDGLKTYCKIININNIIYHKITIYSDNGYHSYRLYINNSAACECNYHISDVSDVGEITLFTPLGLHYNPKEIYDAVNKQYVDSAIANALTTIDNAEALSF